MEPIGSGAAAPLYPNTGGYDETLQEGGGPVVAGWHRPCICQLTLSVVSP